MQTKSLFLVLAIFSVVLTICNLQIYLQLLTWFYLRIMTKQFWIGSWTISTINQTFLCKILCYAFLLFTLLLLFLAKTYAKSMLTKLLSNFISASQVVNILQSWAKCLEQNREIQWNWTGQEKFDIYFGVFFDCCCQSLISGRETGH